MNREGRECTHPHGEGPGRPRRCAIARQKKSRGSRRDSYKKRARQYRVVCCVCGQECMVPVLPPAGKDLTCLSCLDATKPDAS